jgi:hypothetical protein
MREIPAKSASKEALKKIVGFVREAEESYSGQLGRAGNFVADKVEGVFRKPTQAKAPNAFSDSDANKIMNGGGNWIEHPNQRAHHTKMAMEGLAHKIGDHVPNKAHFIKLMEEYNKGIPPQNLSTIKSRGYTKGEINTGRAMHVVGAAGGAVGMEVDKAMDENEAERKERSKGNHSMKQEITTQQGAHSYWTNKKNGGNK